MQDEEIEACCKQNVLLLMGYSKEGWERRKACV